MQTYVWGRVAKMADNVREVLRLEHFNLPRPVDIKFQDFLDPNMVLNLFNWVRWRWAFVALVALAVAGFVFFGFKSGGTVYYEGEGYSAGSVFSPNEYENVNWYGGRSDAEELNELVAAARAKNIPGMVVCVGVAVGSVYLALVACLGLMRYVAVAGPLVEDMQWRAYFLVSYKEETGRQIPVEELEYNLGIPMSLITYAIEVVLRPGAARALAAQGAPETQLHAIQAYAHQGEARVWLTANDLWLRPDGTATRIFGGKGTEPVAGATHAATTRARSSARPSAQLPRPAQAARNPQPMQRTTSGFCPNCGKPVAAGARFCPSCGNRLSNG